jgi:hypothetical protein
MKKNAKPTHLKRALLLFCLSGAIVLMPEVANAQVFEPGARSVYNGFAFDPTDTLSANTLTLVPLANNSIEAPVELNSVASPGDDSMPVALSLELPSKNKLPILRIPDDSVLFPITRPPVPPPANTHAVGEIPVQADVNATGATMYHVSIDVVAGVNGFQPNISINYNSMGGNSVLGVGWSIGGLSAISRANSNMYYNNTTKAPTFSNTDAFVLDGMRLIKSGQVISGATVYLPEQANSNIKVFGYTKHFEVFYPDGKIAIFGDPANTSSTILAYPITKLTDTYGNTVAYTYTFRNGHYYIHRIDYGGDANIQFNYRTRSDVTFGYFSGVKITEDYLLDNISCYDGQTPFRKYAFTYTTQSGALLTQIDCEAGTANKLQPLLFSYGSGQSAAQFLNNQTQLTSWFSLENTTIDANASFWEKVIAQTISSILKNEVHGLIVHKGKFDAYSDDDALIVYPNFQPYYPGGHDGKLFSHSTRHFYSKFHPEQDLLVYQYLKDPYVFPVKIKAGNGFIQLTSADIDGLPGDEVIKVNNYVSGNNDIVEFNTYKPSAISGLARQYTRTFSAGAANDNYGTKSVLLKTFFTGDFNGDGKMELFVIQVQNDFISVGTPRAYLFDVHTGATLFSGNVFTFGSSSETDTIVPQLIPMDFDGDGKTDLCHVHASGTDIYIFESTSTGYTLVKKGATYAALNKNTFHSNTVLLGDVNGDGKTDFLVSPQKSYYTNKTTYVPCPGSGLPTIGDVLVPIQQPAIFVDNLVSQYQVDAIDNFERSIIDYPSLNVGNSSQNCPVTTREYVNNGNQWTVYYAKGGSTSNFEKTTMPICNNEEGYKFLLQDMNEDGAVDFVRRAKGSVSIFLSKNGRISSSAEPQSVSVPTGAYLVPSIVANNTYHTQLLALYSDKIHKISYTCNGAQQKLLTSAVNSAGVVMQNSYARLNDMQYSCFSHYQKGYGAAFPYENFEGPLWVTTATKTYHDETLYTSLSYRYENAVIHKQGLGFCGFQKKTTQDERKGFSVTQICDPYKYGMPVSEESPIAKSEYNFDVLVQANKQAKISLNKKTETDKLKGSSVVTSFQYDAYGNPTSIKTKYADNAENTVNNTYSYKTFNNYVYSLLWEQSVTNTRSNGNAIKRTLY